MSSDFKNRQSGKKSSRSWPRGTAAFAKVGLKEWMKPVDVVVPRLFGKATHRQVYRELTRHSGDRPLQWAVNAALRPRVPGSCAGIHAFSSYLRAYPPPSKSCGSHSEIFRSSAVTAVTGSKDEGDRAAQAAIRLIFFTGASRLARSLWRRRKELDSRTLELGDRIQPSSMRTANSRMQPRRLSGVRRPGAANGVRRPDTLRA